MPLDRSITAAGTNTAVVARLDAVAAIASLSKQPFPQRSASQQRPATQKIVVAIGQAHHAVLVRVTLDQRANTRIEIEQEFPITVRAYHALNPEERSAAHAARDRQNPMKTARWVHHHVARGKA